MARNDERRSRLADAGLQVLAEQGARGLTHRAVDVAAGLPLGTASNYFRSRDDLVAALVDRIAVRLEPDRTSGRPLGATPREVLAAQLRDVVRRLSADPHVPLALFELRLEAARRPTVAEALGAWRRRAFEADVASWASSGLPGDRPDLIVLHHAVDGMMLDHLTVPLDPERSVDDAIEALVDRLLP